METFLQVSEATFEQEVLKAALPIVVEFGAVWCQPCKQLEPVLAKLAVEWNGKARLAKVDVDASANLTMQFQVMSVPTVILFSGGKAVARFNGYQNRERIIEKLQPHLG